ncbi:MAG: biopolymer transporter ExbD [Planctomycetota bacterium]|nr:biopolymer transporter ExbD [Planctomycetota bacterium]
MTDIPEGEETEMNMTPMIDIVFQLIIFFLITLKFKTIDRRIDSQLPKDRGLAPTPAKPPEFEKIKVKLFRKNKGVEAEAFTRIRVGNNKSDTVDLPKGSWPGEATAEYKKLDEVAPYFGKITNIIKKKWAAQGNNPEVTGEIAAMPPDGGAVPHGDIMRVLDIFIQLGIGKVVFEGAAPPLMASEGGTMTGSALTR